MIPPDGVAYNYGAPPPQIGYTGADLRAATGSQSVGSAQPVYGGQVGRVSRPVMLAVLMLTLVSTQLLRTADGEAIRTAPSGLRQRVGLGFQALTRASTAE